MSEIECLKDGILSLTFFRNVVFLEHRGGKSCNTPKVNEIPTIT